MTILGTFSKSPAPRDCRNARCLERTRFPVFGLCAACWIAARNGFAAGGTFAAIVAAILGFIFGWWS